MWNIQNGVWQGAHTSHLLMVKRDVGRRPVEYNWLVMFTLDGGKWEKEEVGRRVTGHLVALRYLSNLFHISQNLSLRKSHRQDNV
jgi:hypothetical protein